MILVIEQMLFLSFRYSFFQAGDDEYSLLVNLKRLYELQLKKPVSSESLFDDMAGILGSLPEMENEVLYDCVLHVERLDSSNPNLHQPYCSLDQVSLYLIETLTLVN
jgi:hypothetical protein